MSIEGFPTEAQIEDQAMHAVLTLDAAFTSAMERVEPGSSTHDVDITMPISALTWAMHLETLAAVERGEVTVQQLALANAHLSVHLAAQLDDGTEEEHEHP